MNEETTNHEEKSSVAPASSAGKLESMSKDELIKLVKTQIVLKKKLETQITELNNANTTLCRSEETLRNQLEDEQIKYKTLLDEFDQEKVQQSKLQQEMNIVRESLECLRSENETLKNQIQNLKDELNQVRSSSDDESQKSLLREFLLTTTNLLQLPVTIPDPIDSHCFQIYRNELERKQDQLKQIFEQFEEEKSHFQQRIEDFEFFNEEIKLEVEDLRSKMSKAHEEKRKMENELDNYRRQVEDFEEQFLELQRESKTKAITVDQSQSIGSSLLTLQPSEEHLDQIEEENEHVRISKASSTSSLLLSSDIPTLLHSVGITNCTDEEFSVPLNFESVLRLATLLIERCRVLQYILLKNDDLNVNARLEENSSKGTITIHQTDQSEQCEIHIPKQEHLAIDTLFERIHTWNNVKISNDQWNILISKPMNETDGKYLRLAFDQISFVSSEIEKDFLRLRRDFDELSRTNVELERRSSTSRTLEQMKQRQTELEEQLIEQCEKTMRLENLLQEGHIDRIQLNQLEHIQHSYQELQDKYRIAEQLEEQLKRCTETLAERDRIFKEQQEKFDLLKQDYQHEHFHRLEREETIRILRLELEEQNKAKEQILQECQRQNERCSSLMKNISDLNEELKKNREDADVQLQQVPTSNNVERESERKSSTNDELNQLREENEKLRQTIEEETRSKENVDEFKEKYQKMKVLLTRLKKELQEKSQQPKQSLIDLELADYEKTIKNLKEDLNNKEKEMQEFRDELSNAREKCVLLQREIETLEEQKSQSEERANKFKTLLDVTKTELQAAKDLEQERHYQDDHARMLIEKLQNDFENQKRLINELNNEKQQLIEKLSHQYEIHQKTMQILEQNLRIANHELEIAKKDYEALQDDFNNYKIRAQSVLKQHQQQSSQRERLPSALEKQQEMEETIEKLKSTLREANNKMQLIISENEILQKEQDRLVESQAKLIHESRKREQELRRQHQLDIEKVERDCLQRINESHEMMRNVTAQNESLSLAFKEQISAIEIDHERSIHLLQQQLQNARDELEQLRTRFEAMRQSNAENEKSTNNSEALPIGINSSMREEIVAWSVSERQQGEGSESANHDSIPSDLASATLQNVLFGNTDSSSSSPLNDLERQRLEDELNKTRLRLTNTTELLNESELNNVRLTEQVALLKDEIRRIERNMERAESISNLEYLKNIILKFFILKSSPERLQLIPVLVTMLKLSPDEQGQLVRVANSPSSVEHSNPTSEPSSPTLNNGVNHDPSWSSYLNIW